MKIKLPKEEALNRLSKVPSVLPSGKWPTMSPPVAIKQDVSQEGLLGQVCCSAWAELTLKTNSEYEKSLDTLCGLFDTRLEAPWAPHISLTYDNPGDYVLQLSDIVGCAMQMPKPLLSIHGHT